MSVCALRQPSDWPLLCCQLYRVSRLQGLEWTTETKPVPAVDLVGTEHQKVKVNLQFWPSVNQLQWEEFFWEAHSRSACQQISRHLGKLKIHYCIATVLQESVVVLTSYSQFNFILHLRLSLLKYFPPPKRRPGMWWVELFNHSAVYLRHIELQGTSNNGQSSENHGHVFSLNSTVSPSLRSRIIVFWLLVFR
jgi:hypothetical protein